jgi:hypothetical protein
MITGFFTFVLWLVLVLPVSVYLEDKPLFPLTKWKVLGMIYILALGGFLIWVYNCYWEYLVMFFGVIMVIVCGVMVFTSKR